MSFLTGARHTATAVAITDTTVWVLHKSDFDQLLGTSRHLAQTVQAFLQNEDMTLYLQQKQGFDPEKASHWNQQAVRSMDRGQPTSNTTRAMPRRSEKCKKEPLAFEAVHLTRRSYR
jgi:CRP-like cAMP-binding protein